MQFINLRLQTEDYPFVVEAIKLRTRVMLEGLAMQVESQRVAAHRSEAQEQVEQKPKRIRAPFGFKKDGTPKKRPGRPKASA
jgi:hypothetical protein